MAELFHIYVKPNEGVDQQAIEAKMSMAIDW